LARLSADETLVIERSLIAVFGNMLQEWPRKMKRPVRYSRTGRLVLPGVPA